MKKIIFSELLENYNTNLITKLRGFGEDNDYLQYWVPGTTKENSLLNLIEALFESKTYEFNIILNKDEEKISSELLKFNGKIGTITMNLENEKINLFFEIDKKLNKLDLKEKTLSATSQNKRFFPEIKSITRIKEKNLVNDSLRKKVISMNIKKFENTNPVKDENCKTYEEKILNHFIYLQIDTKNLIVKNAYHDFKEIKEEFIIIDIFLSQILKKHIQEVSEHSLIYLEDYLRPKNFKKNHGIFLPFQAGSIFEDLNNLIRGVYKKIKTDFDFNDQINKDYMNLSNKWMTMSNVNREITVNKIINESIVEELNLKKDDIILSGIEIDFRIVVELSKDFRKRLKNESLLLKAEMILKEKIEKRLELFTMEVKDQNKLRLKNSPQNII